MRAISRTALGTAIAVALAVTAGVPSVATATDDATGTKPLVGSETGRGTKGRAQSVVTLVTGDKVVVTTDVKGRPAASVLPREDGTEPVVQTRRVGNDLFVYPDGVLQKIDAGLVDEQLFNVTGLVAQGYDDANSDAIPVIATYEKSVDVARSLPVRPRGAERTHILDVIDAVSYKADKEKAASFWADVTSPKTRSGAPVKKLWLDAKAKSTMAESTHQIGADAAWAAGYTGKGTKVAVLDTGIDAEHPDLKGKVVESKDFTGSASGADDRQGHGTHTASTVAGTGAASDGKEKGVAPDAGLLIGKVLNDSGSGSTSGIIEGMQWAVDSGADVISMSLGSTQLSDCSDPMGAAAQELASGTEALFVIAAGNSGPTLNTVSAPGCAPDVLTVGAVDKNDDTANFSSRGPVYGSHTLKPEIAAPGVSIKAAAAGGTGVYAYTTMSGTSMATPHVAGAAALLKQEHPDWSGQRIKQALVSSAKSDITGDVRETGGGSMRVDQALKQTVLGAGAVQAGTYAWPQSKDDRTTVDVPYTNAGDKAVKLSLTIDGVTGNDGSAVRSGIAKLDRRTVTVQPGETVKVPLSIDPTAYLKAAQYGDVTGRVLATGSGGVHVSTPFSLYVAPKTVKLTVKLVDRNGDPAKGASSIDVIGTDVAAGSREANNGAEQLTYELRAGAYELSAFVTTPDAGEDAKLYDSISYLGRPQVNLTKDTAIVLDAREAHRIKAVTKDKKTVTRGATIGYARSWDDYWLHSATVSGGATIRGYYADVQGRPQDGDFSFSSVWRNAAPQMSELTTADHRTLHPTVGYSGSVNLDGTGSADMVYAGTGTADELAAAGVSGKIVLVKIPDDSTSLAPVATAAKAAGAVAVIGYHDSEARWTAAAGFAAPALPMLTLPSDEGKALNEKPSKLSWKAEANSPYAYNLAYSEDEPITSARTYEARDRKLARVDSTYRAAGVATDFVDMNTATTEAGITASPAAFDRFGVPGERSEYYTAGDGTAWERAVSSSLPWGEAMIGLPTTYKAGRHTTESWYDGVLVPTAPLDDTGAPVLVGERQANLIGVNLGGAFWRDGSHYGVPGSFGDSGGLKLRRDGNQIGSRPVPYGAFEIPSDEASYELELTTFKAAAPAKFFQRSNKTVTVFAFKSKEDLAVYSQGVPLLFPKYAIPEDGMKTLAAKDGQQIELSATGHQGYTPGKLTDAKLSYSYDGGTRWTEAKTQRKNGGWAATVNHEGASGKQVTLKTQLTDDKGNSVTQTVTRAYDVR
ncbi:S8 family peptidase [Streptomyces sp. NPDC051956]|uniref:S8 family peptidase n=1 Tax=Streptomyces sp. NPDC051956 TaxID=3365677 RepID=UPI0037D8B89B